MIALWYIGVLIGMFAYYLRYKVLVYEKAKGRKQGMEAPIFKPFKAYTLFHYYRGYYFHFYKYKLFYFLDEQVVDPLNDNALSPGVFDVYQFKRLIRKLKYDEVRDPCFDFMGIGEDDVEEFDDFV
jgi:hypothetical protein